MKQKIVYVCPNCGNEFLKWSGKCDSCNSWNTLKGIKEDADRSQNEVKAADFIRIKDVKTAANQRIKSNVSEFDSVLGGGIVRGSVLLLGGQPGIGKSTLIWQVVNSTDMKVAYIAAEESPEQIKIRSSRIGKENNNVYLISSPEINSAMMAIKKISPELVVVDSVQTIYDSSYPSIAGSIIQVKQCAMKIMNFAKRSNIAFIIIGHVTKEGEVAGPKTLEHLVDGVFYLEGVADIPERFLRSQKNRFGPSEELGVFKMTQKGFSGEEDFGQKRLGGKLPSGIAVAAVNEGNRVYFIEVQALTQKTYFGYPRRNSVGYDLNRLNMIIAIISRSLKIDLSNHDVYLNVAQGYKIKDPSADLAVAAAIVGAYKNKPLSGKSIYIGELDLAGRVNEVINQNQKIKAAKKIGAVPIILKDLGSIGF